MPGQDPLEHRRELRAAVIDHLAAAGDADRRRQGRGTRDAEIRFEAVHGDLRLTRTGWTTVDGAGPDGRTG